MCAHVRVCDRRRRMIAATAPLEPTPAPAPAAAVAAGIANTFTLCAVSVVLRCPAMN